MVLVRGILGTLSPIKVTLFCCIKWLFSVFGWKYLYVHTYLTLCFMLTLSDPVWVLFAIPLSKLIANIFGWAFQFQNLMVFLVECIYMPIEIRYFIQFHFKKIFAFF